MYLFIFLIDLILNKKKFIVIKLSNMPTSYSYDNYYYVFFNVEIIFLFYFCIAFSVAVNI